MATTDVKVIDRTLLEQDTLFSNLEQSLDNRLVKAVQKQGLIHPTLVQVQCIPLALEGKDLLVRAKTGSGKTLAYTLPLLQKVINAKESAGPKASPQVRGVILVPTRELVTQVQSVVYDMTYYCRDLVRVVGLGSEKLETQLTWLKHRPDVIIATPGRLVCLLDQLPNEGLLKTSVETLVVDEADLIFSYGYASDIERIVSELPKICQSFLMSATLDDSIDELKSLVLHNPAVVKLEEGSTDGHLAQWYLPVGEDDKDLVVYALLRLKLVQGKTVFFVNSVDKCYRLKLLLERFSIRSGVLNSELPANSRQHILQEFNKGLFDNLIATDESVQAVVDDDAEEEESDDEEDEKDDTKIKRDSSADNDDGESGSEGEDSDEKDNSNSESDEESEDDNKNDKNSDSDEESEDDNKDGSESDDNESDQDKSSPKDDEEESEEKEEAKEETITKRKAKGSAKSKRKANDEEFGVSRGVDFRGVTTVVNVDLPRTVDGYIHRIGRTARGGASGVALSIVNMKDKKEAALLERIQTAQDMIPNPDESVGGEVPQPSVLALDLKELEGFRYRVRDVRRTVTRIAVQDARAREIKMEMLNSQRLKAHFEENPRDLQLLKHDSALRPTKVQPHLSHIPSYLMPNHLKTSEYITQTKGNSRKRAAAVDAKKMASDVGQSVSGRQRWKERHRKGKFSNKRRKKDPLF